MVRRLRGPIENLPATKSHGANFPSLIPQRSGERVKTDRRDARKLARLLRSGELTPVWVADEKEEALRHLTRAYEDAQEDILRKKNQNGKLLLCLDSVTPLYDFFRNELHNLVQDLAFVMLFSTSIKVNTLFEYVSLVKNHLDKNNSIPSSLIRNHTWTFFGIYAINT
ncbi:IS110 family transposase [Neomoorella glycerini]|uniref:IS110 family transposase n=1 Tax=Neomoorella glycerini TaxID=55779 RepID=UPI001478077A